MVSANYRELIGAGWGAAAWWVEAGERAGVQGCFCPAESSLPKGHGDPGPKVLRSKTPHNSPLCFIKGSFIPFFLP